MLRRLLLLVLALWLGMGLGISFVAIPHVFSPAVRDALPSGGPGRIAQGILLRTFWAQAGLAAAACLLHGATRREAGMPGVRQRDLLLPALLATSLAALFWVHPTMRGHFERKHDPALAEAERTAAGREFAAWHGASQAGNLLVLAGVLACSWKLTQAHAHVPRKDAVGPTGLGTGDSR